MTDTHTTDLLIRHVTAVTMDSERRVIDDAAVAVRSDRILAIGPDAEIAAAHAAAEKFEARGMVAIPGLIDGHSHAGHGLVRSLGAGDGKAWYDACAEIYARGSTVEFWRAEARLALLERLKAGVTTAVSLLGGGDDVYRTDDPAYGDAHCDATRESGLRTMLAVGPGRRPFPHHYRRPYPQARDIALTFERQMEVSEDLIRRRNDIRGDRTGVCLIMPVYHSAELAEARAEIAAMAETVAELQARYGTMFTQDGHRNGTIAIAHELGLLGPFALLSHSVDLTQGDFAALAESGAHIVHNPSAIMSVYGRCPAPELIEKRVTVCLGSDAGAPDRGFDMFRHMAQCMHYHRRHFRDPSCMPPGKVLEMATIDAALALGLQDDLGSLEPGKKADIVLVDMRKPHLWPPNMPVTRLAHFANAADVDTVMVGGRILMQGRRPRRVETDTILEGADRELTLALERTGLRDLTREPRGYWASASRFAGRYPVND